MEATVKNQLIKSIEAIKKKIKQMREEEELMELKRRQLFRPISDPLESLVSYKNEENNHKTISSKNKSPTLYDTNDSNPSSNSDNNINNKKKNLTPKLQISCENSQDVETIRTPSPIPESACKNLNVPFGVRSENSTLMIGNTKITFSGGSDTSNKNMIAKIGSRSYEITPGLSELLFQSKPDIAMVSEQDKLVYKDILCNTSAHKRDYNPLNQIKGDKGIKYTKIVKPLFSETELDNKAIKQGGFMPTLKRYKKNTDFIYWDDPNELIYRLKILFASKDAGNTSHDNEIISIIEELKEAGIIK